MKKVENKKMDKKLVVLGAVVAGIFVAACTLIAILRLSSSQNKNVEDSSEVETSEDSEVDDVAEKKTKRVGDETYGFVTVPEDWKEMKTKTGKMYGGDGKYVSLLVAEKSKINASEWTEALKNEFSEDEFSEIKSEEVTVNEKKMQKISGKFKKI